MAGQTQSASPVVHHQVIRPGTPDIMAGNAGNLTILKYDSPGQSNRHGKELFHFPGGRIPPKNHMPFGNIALGGAEQNIRADGTVVAGDACPAVVRIGQLAMMIDQFCECGRTQTEKEKTENQHLFQDPCHNVHSGASHDDAPMDGHLLIQV